MYKVRIFLTDIEIEELTFYASQDVGLREIAVEKIKEYCASKGWWYNPYAWDIQITAPNKPLGETVVTWPVIIVTLFGLITLFSIFVLCVI